jgi:hypothetical protein
MPTSTPPMVSTHACCCAYLTSKRSSGRVFLLSSNCHSVMEGREGKGGREEERPRCDAQGRREVGAEAIWQVAIRRPPTPLQHVQNTRSTFKISRWNICNIRLKQIKLLKHALETCVYRHCNMCNAKIYFWNVLIKHLQHMSKTPETLET